MTSLIPDISLFVNISSGKHIHVQVLDEGMSFWMGRRRKIRDTLLVYFCFVLGFFLYRLLMDKDQSNDTWHMIAEGNQLLSLGSSQW